MNASLAKLSSKDTQLVRCASSLGIYSRLITRVVKPFRAKNASARITVQELDDKSCEQAVINGDADLGFCIGPNDSEYFDVYQIESHHLSAMVCKRNPLHTKSTLTLEDLGDYPLAIVNNRFKINSNFCKACKDRGISPNIEFQGGDVVSVHNFSRFENNIAITVDYLAKEICYPESVVTTLDVPELDWTINMVIAKHNNLTPAAASLALIVQEAFPC